MSKKTHTYLLELNVDDMYAIRDMALLERKMSADHLQRARKNDSTYMVTHYEDSIRKCDRIIALTDDPPVVLRPTLDLEPMRAEAESLALDDDDDFEKLVSLVMRTLGRE